MDRALSDDDIPTLQAFPVPGQPKVARALVIDTAVEGFFAVGLTMNDIAPASTDEELAAWWGAQRRRDLCRYVVAIVVVCVGIMAASAVRLG